MKAFDSKTQDSEDTALANVITRRLNWEDPWLWPEPLAAFLTRTFSRKVSCPTFPTKRTALVQRRATHGKRCCWASAKLSLLLRIRPETGQHQHEQRIHLFGDSYSSSHRKTLPAARRRYVWCAGCAAGVCEVSLRVSVCGGEGKNKMGVVNYFKK